MSDLPEEYVADIYDLSTFERGTISSAEGARVQVTRYLEERLEVVLERDSRRPSVMLSGGIDSILLAAVLHKVRPDALAITVHFGSDYGEDPETMNAVAAAQHLGFEHEVVVVDSAQALRWAQECVLALDSRDPWEVLAGIILKIVDQRARKSGAPGVIFSGAGADALFLGGNAQVTPETWGDALVKSIESHFTHQRAIPDFYERLLEEPARHIQVWQTLEATALAFKLSPFVVRGPEFDTDKLLLRETAIHIGVPRDLAMREKIPMQVSSGGVRALVQGARQLLASDPQNLAYADPRQEDVEYTVLRLLLNLLSR